MTKDKSGNEKGGRKSLKTAIIILLAAAVLGGGGFGAYKYSEYREYVRTMEAAVYVDVYYAGITVDGVDVGGMSREEARQAVEEKMHADLDVPGITVTCGDREWVYTKNDLIDADNVDDILDRAWTVGRNGTLEERYQQVMVLQESGRSFDVDVTYDADKIETDIGGIAQTAAIAPQNAQIHFDPTVDPMFTYTDEVNGQEADVVSTMAMVKKAVSDGMWGEVALIVDPIIPEVIKADLTPLSTSIVDFSTSIAGNTANRAHNVRHALRFIDGYVLGPGETFSFNEVVGRRTEERGFMLAPIINRDKALVPGYGGGTCQSSTTTYNAAVRAGMKIEERYPHSFPVGYIPKGLDATVSYGTQDLVFTNTRETPVYFHTYYENHRVHVQIFGMPFPDDGQIKCSYEITETIPAPASVVRTDSSHTYVKEPGQYIQYAESRTGYRVTSYTEYYKDGELVDKKVLAQTYYPPIQGIILCYPGYEHMTGGEVVTPLPH